MLLLLLLVLLLLLWRGPLDDCGSRRWRATAAHRRGRRCALLLGVLFHHLQSSSISLQKVKRLEFVWVLAKSISKCLYQSSELLSCEMLPLHAW